MTKYIVQNETEWHALRSLVVTASEAAVLVGADPYSSPAKIRETSTFTGNAFTQVGQLLEKTVVELTNKKLGTHFELYENTAGHKEFYVEGILGATPDAHEDRATLLECKTVNSKTYMKYSAVPPNKYIIQLMVQMICTGINQGYLALIDTKLKTMEQYEHFLNNVKEQSYDITVYKVLQNDIISGILIEEAARFASSKQFRVNSKLKQKVKLLLPLTWERIA